MRFEIKFGGAFVILVGLFTLSGAVFLLGLYAGYQMERQNQPAMNQISSSYPIPGALGGAAPPAAETNPASASSPAIASGASSIGSGVPPTTQMKSSAPGGSANSGLGVPSAPSARSTAGAIARARPPAISTAVKAPPADEDETSSSDTGEGAAAPAVASSEARPAHKPFNIQIEAVMDKSGADEMITRLRGLGYHAQETTTSLGGQTWYRVRVGPYDSEDEARAAETKLREQYKHAFAPR